MPLEIRFVRLTLSIDIPVCSRTEAEAREIAGDVLADKLGITMGDAPAIDTIEIVSQPANMTDDETVWGEAVPEDAMTVGLLRKWLEKRK